MLYLKKLGILSVLKDVQRIIARVIGIGHQDFAQLITSGCFYIDKTDFIREW